MIFHAYVSQFISSNLSASSSDVRHGGHPISMRLHRQSLERACEAAFSERLFPVSFTDTTSPTVVITDTGQGTPIREHPLIAIPATNAAIQIRSRGMLIIFLINICIQIVIVLYYVILALYFCIKLIIRCDIDGHLGTGSENDDYGPEHESYSKALPTTTGARGHGIFYCEVTTS